MANTTFQGVVRSYAGGGKGTNPTNLCILDTSAT